MHPDLSPHLHTDECNNLIKHLHDCHATNKFKKFLGVCSDLDRQVINCLKKEREENRRKNAEAAMKKRKKITESSTI